MAFNDLFLRACRCEPTERTPIWMMRQAGRYMPEYRAIRKDHDFLQMCKQPELAVEVTLQPVDLIGVDAAILFADILLPLEGMGLELSFAKGEGPVIHNPVRDLSDVKNLRISDAVADTGYVMEAIRQLRHELRDKVPLIGFAGAPFTLACYLVEGGPSREFVRTRTLMRAEPALWDALMERLTQTTIAYLAAQVAAGAQAVQVFDSWVGGLSPLDYARSVQPWMARIFAAVRALGVPAIHFGTGTAGILALQAEAGGDVIGLDWRIALADGRARVGDRAVQGNLDPTLLLGPWDATADAARWVLAQNGGRPGHVFNLGHGVLPGTDPDHLARLVDLVHGATASAASPAPLETAR